MHKEFITHSFLCSRLTPSLLKRGLVDPQVRGNLVSEKTSVSRSYFSKDNHSPSRLVQCQNVLVFSFRPVWAVRVRKKSNLECRIFCTNNVPIRSQPHESNYVKQVKDKNQWNSVTSASNALDDKTGYAIGLAEKIWWFFSADPEFLLSRPPGPAHSPPQAAEPVDPETQVIIGCARM